MAVHTELDLVLGVPTRESILLFPGFTGPHLLLCQKDILISTQGQSCLLPDTHIDTSEQASLEVLDWHRTFLTKQAF